MVQRDQWDTYWGPKKIIFLIRDIDDATTKLLFRAALTEYMIILVGCSSGLDGIYH